MVLHLKSNNSFHEDQKFYLWETYYLMLVIVSSMPYRYHLLISALSLCKHDRFF